MGKVSIDRYDFPFDEELIAQFPVDKRDESRLLYVNRRGEYFKEYKFKDIVDLIDENSFIVLNNTKVLKARIYGNKKSSGGKVELLLTEMIDNNKFRAILGGKWKREGCIIVDKEELFVSKRDDDGFVIVDFKNRDPFDFMEKYGHVPLPPYIKREDTEEDEVRYNTVYSKEKGSIAAPTAGLHFTTEILNRLKGKGVEVLEITLNVGMGTFKPVSTQYIDDHKMHKETYSIKPEVADKINFLKSKNKKLIAVGTTVVRALESSTDERGVVRGSYNEATALFIREGYTFKIVDKMITNFHLPKSTLFILVCAFGGYELMKRAYAYAVNNRFRFFSYGDAMFIE